MASRWGFGSVLWLETHQAGWSAPHLRKHVAWPFPETSHQKDPQCGSVWNRGMGASMGEAWLCLYSKTSWGTSQQWTSLCLSAYSGCCLCSTTALDRTTSHHHTK